MIVLWQVFHAFFHTDPNVCSDTILSFNGQTGLLRVFFLTLNGIILKKSLL